MSYCALRSCVAAIALMLLAGAANAQWAPVFAGGGPNDVVNALVVASPTPGALQRLFAGGHFTSVTTSTGSLPAQYIASWDGHAWVPGAGVTAMVASLAVHPFGGTPTLFAGKTTVTGPGGPLARLINGQWVEMPAGTQGWIHGIASYDLGQGPRLALSATFFTPSSYIAAWNNGSLEGMGSGLISVTKAFAMYDDGQGLRLFAGMGAESVPGLSFLAKFDGTEWTMPEGGPNQPVYAMVVFDDGSGPALFIGGDFLILRSGLSAPRVAKYQNGQWSALGTGLSGGGVRSMAVFDDGSGPALYVGGDFTTAGGQPASRIARWRNGQWSALDSGITGGTVLTMAVFDDDGAGPTPPALYVGGAFSSAGGQPASRIARWGATACYANCDGSVVDPRLNANDFQCFLNSFASGNLSANCDGSATAPILTANDFQCFLNAFAAGCP